MTHSIRVYTEDGKQVRYCTKCSCEQHELPTDCPGEVVRQNERNLIAKGELDFRAGQWLNPQPKLAI